MNNPFTLSFGKKPVQYISRIAQTERIIGDFTAEESPNQIYMITGVRGSGKTVMMTNIASEIRKRSDEWIVVELNPNRDLLQSLAAKIYAIPEMHAVFVKAKLDFSVFGLGVTVENAVPVTDIENVIEIMLSHIKRLGKRLLITIDEVINSENIKIFASSFQIFLREEYPIYLLMTGLYENIYDLQNEKSLTFLYRAPKIQLKPLNNGAIINKYKTIFNISQKQASQMAELTKGYPFAFQVLGYLTWNNSGDYHSVLGEYAQYLSEFVYDKIWSELSPKDRAVAKAIVDVKSGKIKDIREQLGMETNEFNPYRKRLIKKGIVSGEMRGYVYFTLPLFDEYVIENY